MSAGHPAAERGPVRRASRQGGPLWGLAEVAAEHGISKQLANAWTRRESFPAPAYVLAAGRFWWAREVRAWRRKVVREGLGRYRSGR